MYNSSLQSVMLTLKSIINQTFKDYEIIIADDGSLNKWEYEIKQYLNKNNFENYFFAPSEVNVGTVENIWRALSFAKGKYIKCIGAGDMFYDKNTLEFVYDEMELECAKFAFGEMLGYCIKNSHIEYKQFRAPLDLKPYLNGDLKKVCRNIIILQDYISGASMFFEKNFFQTYLKKIIGRVKYAEDILQVLMALNNESILFLKRRVVIYEVGNGISTSKRKSSRILTDFDNFENVLEEYYPDNNLVKKRVERNNIITHRKFLYKYMYLLLTSFKHIWYEKHRIKNIRVDIEERGFLRENIFCEEFNID